MPWKVSFHLLSVVPLWLQLRIPGALPLTLGEGGCFLRYDFHVVTLQSYTPAPACGDASLCCLSVGWSTGAPEALPSHADSTPLHMNLLLACTMWLAEVSTASGRVAAAWVRPHCGLWAGEDLGILCES